MDILEDTTFVGALQQVPDPRHARGMRHTWSVIVTVISAALAAGCRTPHAIGHWVGLHAHVLQPVLCASATRLPSESTIVRALRHVDIAALERQIAHFVTSAHPVSTPPSAPSSDRSMTGVALDGKRVRGASMHGQALHLVSMVQHGSGTTLAQVAVVHKRNELAAVPAILMGRNLTATVVTMDALFTHRNVAQTICDQHGHYLMMVKQNQRTLATDLELFFRCPAIVADKEHWGRTQTINKGHGRLETRVLECGTAVWEAWHWPHVAQIMRRTCTRVCLATGEVTTAVSYGVTDLTPEQAGAAELEAFWRGHWTIENRSHYVRDVTLGEDAGQAHTGHTAHVLAAWRNGILYLLRRAGWTNIADAVRAYAAAVHDALALVGAYPL